MNFRSTCVFIFAALSTYTARCFPDYSAAHGGDEVSRARWWDSAYPQLGAVVDQPGQMRAMLSKLEAGEPITVVGIGSSVMRWAGGCFHTSLVQVFAATGLDDAFVESRGPNEDVYVEDCPRDGYVGLFMRMVNNTWPNADHLFINMGRGGATLHTNSYAFCDDDMLPRGRHVDLFIVARTDDLSSQYSPAVDMEHLMHQARRLL